MTRKSRVQCMYCIIFPILHHHYVHVIPSRSTILVLLFLRQWIPKASAVMILIKSILTLCCPWNDDFAISSTWDGAVIHDIVCHRYTPKYHAMCCPLCQAEPTGIGMIEMRPAWQDKSWQIWLTDVAVAVAVTAAAARRHHNFAWHNTR